MKKYEKVFGYLITVLITAMVVIIIISGVIKFYIYQDDLFILGNKITEESMVGYWVGSIQSSDKVSEFKIRFNHDSTAWSEGLLDDTYANLSQWRIQSGALHLWVGDASTTNIIVWQVDSFNAYKVYGETKGQDFFQLKRASLPFIK